MTTASTIPAAIDAAVALCERVADGITDAPGGKVKVIDGPTKHTARTVIAVAHPGGGVQTGATPALAAQTAISGLVLGQDTESYAIGCLVETWSGNGTYKRLREVAFGIVDAIVGELALDQTLGRVVMRARIAVLDYTQALTPDGPSVVVPFQIHVDGRRSLS